MTGATSAPQHFPQYRNPVATLRAYGNIPVDRGEVRPPPDARQGDGHTRQAASPNATVWRGQREGFRMPWRNPSPCTTPGCSHLAAPGRGQCTECVARAQLRRATNRAGYDELWSDTSRAFLAVHRLCMHPGCTAPATETHHRDGLGPTGPRGHDWSNLEALCKRHHSVRTAQATGFHRRR